MKLTFISLVAVLLLIQNVISDEDESNENSLANGPKKKARCGRYEKLKKCGCACIEKCEKRLKPESCPKLKKVTACYCLQGFYRNSTGVCVPADQCDGKHKSPDSPGGPDDEDNILMRGSNKNAKNKTGSDNGVTNLPDNYGPSNVPEGLVQGGLSPDQLNEDSTGSGEIFGTVPTIPPSELNQGGPKPEDLNQEAGGSLDGPGGSSPQDDDCGPNERFTDCGNKCKESVEFVKREKDCPDVCEKGCFCIPKYYRDGFNNCNEVPDKYLKDIFGGETKKAPEPKCVRQNEKYDDCGDRCKELIYNKDNHTLCKPYQCLRGCYCMDGFLRESVDGICVPGQRAELDEEDDDDDADNKGKGDKSDDNDDDNDDDDHGQRERPNRRPPNRRPGRGPDREFDEEEDDDDGDGPDGGYDDVPDRGPFRGYDRPHRGPHRQFDDEPDEGYDDGPDQGPDDEFDDEPERGPYRGYDDMPHRRPQREFDDGPDQEYDDGPDMDPDERYGEGPDGPDRDPFGPDRGPYEPFDEEEPDEGYDDGPGGPYDDGPDRDYNGGYDDGPDRGPYEPFDDGPDDGYDDGPGGPYDDGPDSEPDEGYGDDGPDRDYDDNDDYESPFERPGGPQRKPGSLFDPMRMGGNNGGRSPKCPKNEEYKKCGNRCLENIENVDNPRVCPTNRCDVGCFCAQDFYRNKVGVCIQQFGAHPKKKLSSCPPRELFTKCGNRCMESLENRLSRRRRCNPDQCDVGCFCMPDYYRDRSGQCVQEFD